MTPTEKIYLKEAVNRITTFLISLEDRISNIENALKSIDNQYDEALKEIQDKYPNFKNLSKR
jgi:flagellar capping protein FliD